MSGQPNRYASDPARFRKEFMDSLALRADIDSMNLEANKTYIATGQLPAVSQMAETRTTSEILADTEKVKASLVAELKTIGSANFALAVVQGIQKSHLNLGGSLLTFFAQRSPEIISNLKKSYKYGIVGDDNDVRQFVSFIEDMYNKSKSFSSSVKNYFNTPYSGYMSGRLSFGDIESIIPLFNDLSRKLLLKMRTPSERKEQAGWKEEKLLPREREIKKISDTLYSISELLRAEDFISNRDLFIESQRLYAGDEHFDGLIDKIFNAFMRYNEILEELPKPESLYSLLEQFSMALKNSNPSLAFKILNEFRSQITFFEGLHSYSSELLELKNEYERFVELHKSGAFEPRPNALSPEKVGPISISGVYNPLTLPTQMKEQEVRNTVDIDSIKDRIRNNESGMRHIEGEIGDILDEIDRLSDAKRQLIGRPKSEVEDMNNEYGKALTKLKARLDQLNERHVLIQNKNKELLSKLGMGQEQSSELAEQRLNPSQYMPLRKPEEREEEREEEIEEEIEEPEVSEPSKYSGTSIGDLEESIKHDIDVLDTININLRKETISDSERVKYGRLYDEVLEDMEDKLISYKKMPKTDHDKERGRHKLLEKVNKKHDETNAKIKKLFSDNNSDKDKVKNLGDEISDGTTEKRLKQIKGEQTKLTQRIKKNVKELKHLERETGKLDHLIEIIQGGINGLDMGGNGLPKRRGRPKGSGLVKHKTYKEIVKAHSNLNSGISESPRFVKFGKYLINTQKLNDDTLALKQPSGGNIPIFPSTRISKNMSHVIKKMIGNGMPTYAELSKLSEPEKAYLHKISSKANILDKFSIPAPDKDREEKDIHEFEVMKGEIMAGNDSKELIKKFKLHLVKLSRTGTLPKKEAQEVMEELINLGY